VEQKLVALLGGGVAIVARDRDGDGGGEERTAKGVDLGEGGIDDVDGVGAGALREADGDGGLKVGACGAVKDVVGGFFAGVGDGGDVAEIDWSASVGADDDGADIGGVAEERAGFEEKLGVGKRARAGLEGAVGGLEGGASWATVRLRAARAAGSSWTRTARRTPPMTVVSATCGTVLRASSTWAASRRRAR
jgi:hypothetical protein